MRQKIFYDLVETGDITAGGRQQYVPAIIVFVRARILGSIFSPFSLSKSFATQGVSGVVAKKNLGGRRNYIHLCKRGCIPIHQLSIAKKS